MCFVEVYIQTAGKWTRWRSSSASLMKSFVFSYLDKTLSQNFVPLTQLKKVEPERWQKTKEIFEKVMGAFYSRRAVKPANKSVSALAGFLCKCTMMELKEDAVLRLRLIKGEQENSACLCGCRNAVSTAGLERKRAGNEKQNGGQKIKKNATKRKIADSSQTEWCHSSANVLCKGVVYMCACVNVFIILIMTL